MSASHPATRFFSGSAILSLILALGVLTIGGCPSVPPDGNGGGTTEKIFGGAETCMACHAENHSDWSATRHAGAMDTLAGIGQDANESCVGCHSVGFGSGGFTSVAATPELAGVQCENCHGAGAAHAADPGNLELRPVINMSASLCGECHNDAHHPTFEEWSLSKHGSALEGLISSGFAQDTCLECHSQDYRYAIERQAEGDMDIVVPTTETASLSLECATCHSSHGGVDQEHQLLKPIASLCGECHTQGEEALPGNTPHHPQLEMLLGTGAVQEDGSALDKTHTHSTLAATDEGQACAQCHVVSHEVEDPNEGNPNVTGHTFNPFDPEITTHQADQYTGCTMCHGTAETADALRTVLQGDVVSRLAALAPYFDVEDALYIDPAGLDEADALLLANAKFNYQFVGADGSSGVHNPTNARAALDVAESIVATLSGS